MHITTFDEFRELAQRGHVRAGLQGDRGRPSDAGVRLPQNRRAFRLCVPARIGGRRRAGWSLLVPRQGSVPDPAVAPRQDDHRPRRPDVGIGQAVHRGRARADGGLSFAIRAGSAALHGRGCWLPGVRRRGLVRTRRAAADDRGRGRSGLHAVRHGAGVRPRAPPDSDHRERADYRRRRPGVAVPVRARQDRVRRARAGAHALEERAGPQ